MTQETTQEENAELAAMKAVAQSLGVSFHPNIKLVKLSEKIAAHVDKLGKEATKSEPTLTEKQETKLTPQQERAAFIKENLKLVRIRLTCMNPNKKEWKGDYFTVSNSIIPTQKKYVEFGVPWHVPKIMLNMIKERKCQLFRNVKRGDRTIREGYLVNEFNVEMLPPMTAKEFEELKKQQLLKGSIDR